MSILPKLKNLHRLTDSEYLYELSKAFKEPSTELDPETQAELVEHGLKIDRIRFDMEYMERTAHSVHHGGRRYISPPPPRNHILAAIQPHVHVSHSLSGSSEQSGTMHSHAPASIHAGYSPHPTPHMKPHSQPPQLEYSHHDLYEQR